MTWTYGETLCIEPHIPVGDWVYGEILCTTLPTVVYPTLAWVRVTSLVHRWNPGRYTLTLGLGELTTEFIMPDVIERPEPTPAVVPEPGPPVPEPPIPPMPECIEGNYTCMGNDKYVCFEGRWRLAEKNAPECMGGGCLEGSYRCEGTDLYVCFEGRWRLAERNSLRCGYVPPTPTPPVPPTPPPVPPTPPEPVPPEPIPPVPPEPIPPTPTPPEPPTPPVTGCTYEGITYSQGAYVCMGRDKYVCFERMWRLAQKNAPECGGGI